MKRLSLFFAALLVSVSSIFAAGNVVASWTFTSGSYPANSTDFAATAGTWKTSSVFNLNGTGSTWSTSKKSYAFTAVTDITVTVVAGEDIAKGTTFKLAGTTAYNKSTNAPVTGFNITCKENNGTATETTPKSWSLSTTLKDYEVSYTTQQDLQKGAKISFVLTQTGKIGSGQAFINNISVTREMVSSVEKPTISVAEGSVDENGFYADNLQVTLACATEGATIRYTLDDTEPTATSAEYTAALSFTNEFVTLQAKAFKGEDASYAVDAQYYHKSSADVPYTTTEALKLYKDKGKNIANTYVAGTVTDVTPNADYNNANYTITDGTNTLYVFRGETDATSGLADILTLVEGDKVVVNGTISAYGQNTQIAAGSKVVKWTENTNPVLSSSVSAINFGSISMYADAPKKTITVIGKNLTEDITITLSDKAAFFVDNTTLPAAGGTITVTPNMEELGENAATLTLKSGEKTVTVSLSSEILLANIISWSVNGKITATTEVIYGDPVVLPAAPEVPNACSNKTFMGWTTMATVAADGTDIEWVTASTVPTKDVTYYAVFALVAEGTESTTATIDFSEQEYKNGQSVEGVKIAIDDDVNCVFAKSASGSNEPAYYDSGAAIRLYAGGTLTISALSTITDVKITFGSSDKTNTLTANVGEWDGSEWTGEANAVTLTVTGSDGHRRFAGLSVTYKATTISEYATECSGIGSDIANVAVENIVTKIIENGQLIIIRDGVRYNAQGQRME